MRESRIVITQGRVISGQYYPPVRHYVSLYRLALALGIIPNWRA